MPEWKEGDSGVTVHLASDVSKVRLSQENVPKKCLMICVACFPGDLA